MRYALPLALPLLLLSACTDAQEEECAALSTALSAARSDTGLPPLASTPDVMESGLEGLAKRSMTLVDTLNKQKWRSDKLAPAVGKLAEQRGAVADGTKGVRAALSAMSGTQDKTEALLAGIAKAMSGIDRHCVESKSKKKRRRRRSKRARQKRALRAKACLDTKSTLEGAPKDPKTLHAEIGPFIDELGRLQLQDHRKLGRAVERLKQECESALSALEAIKAERDKYAKAYDTLAVELLAAKETETTLSGLCPTAGPKP